MATLTSKERVRRAFARQEPDRVPIDYMANPGIDARLKAHFGLTPHDDEGLRRMLGVDFRGIWIPYVGPKRHPDVPGLSVDAWGVRKRWVEHGAGGYWDCCEFPLRDASVEEVRSWPLPSPDDFDYSVVDELCERYKDYFVTLGDPGIGDIINSTGFLRTMEQALVDLITEDEAGLLLVDRKLDINYEMMRRMLEAGHGRFDMLWMGEDLGTQLGPLIGLDLFRKIIRPRQQRFVDLAHAWNIPVMIHSCGSSSWAFDDFIDMGIGIVDTLQPEVRNMSPAYLKERFGSRLAFHGSISTAGCVSFGSVDETVEHVKETLRVMMPGGGYALAPTHQLQDNSPTENVVALYETARTFGRYDHSGSACAP
jgi:uroporphyrinogen decarboxylase